MSFAPQDHAHFVSQLKWAREYENHPVDASPLKAAEDRSKDKVGGADAAHASKNQPGVGERDCARPEAQEGATRQASIVLPAAKKTPSPATLSRSGDAAIKLMTTEWQDVVLATAAPDKLAVVMKSGEQILECHPPTDPLSATCPHGSKTCPGAGQRQNSCSGCNKDMRHKFTEAASSVEGTESTSPGAANANHKNQQALTAASSDNPHHVRASCPGRGIAFAPVTEHYCTLEANQDSRSGERGGGESCSKANEERLSPPASPLREATTKQSLDDARQTFDHRQIGSEASITRHAAAEAQPQESRQEIPLQKAAPVLDKPSAFNSSASSQHADSASTESSDPAACMRDGSTEASGGASTDSSSCNQASTGSRQDVDDDQGKTGLQLGEDVKQTQLEAEPSPSGAQELTIGTESRDTGMDLDNNDEDMSDPGRSIQSDVRSSGPTVENCAGRGAMQGGLDTCRAGVIEDANLTGRSKAAAHISDVSEDGAREGFRGPAETAVREGGLAKIHHVKPFSQDQVYKVQAVWNKIKQNPGIDRVEARSILEKKVLFVLM